MELTDTQVIDILNSALQRESLKKNVGKSTARIMASNYYYDERMLKMRNAVYEIPESQIEVVSTKFAPPPRHTAPPTRTTTESTSAKIIKPEKTQEPIKTPITEKPEPQDFWETFAKIYLEIK